jgi:hypothetical protein
MIYENININFFPHVYLDNNEIKKQKIIRIILSCNKKRIFSSKMKKILLILYNMKKEIQIELPVLSQLLIKDITENKNLISKYNLKLIVNCYGGINLLNNLKIDVFLGRFFCKTMNKYPNDYLYPKGILMNFDIILKLYSTNLILMPFQIEFYKYVANKFNIKGFDIEKNLFSLLKKETIKELANFTNIYIINDSFGATSDNCCFKYFNKQCNQTECTKKFYFNYINMLEKENIEIPILFFAVGQNIYFENNKYNELELK